MTVDTTHDEAVKKIVEVVETPVVDLPREIKFMKDKFMSGSKGGNNDALVLLPGVAIKALGSGGQMMSQRSGGAFSDGLSNKMSIAQFNQ